MQRRSQTLAMAASQTRNNNAQQAPQYPVPAIMQKGVPAIPQKDFQGPFQFLENVERMNTSSNASDASNNDFSIDVPQGYLHYTLWRGWPLLKKIAPKTLLKKLKDSQGNNEDETRLASTSITINASKAGDNRQEGHPTKPITLASTAGQNASHDGTYILRGLSTEIRFMIYDLYFKGTKQEGNKPPALVIALRCSQNYYLEVIERYYRGCNLTLSEENLRFFQDEFPMHRARLLEHLTLEKEYVAILLSYQNLNMLISPQRVTLPTLNSINHKYTNGKPYSEQYDPRCERPPEKVKLTRRLETWLDANQWRVEDDYPTKWQDLQGVAENLLSFASMAKFQIANLRSLTLRTDVDCGYNNEALCYIVKKLYEHFPLLKELIIKNRGTNADTKLIYTCRDEFILGKWDKRGLGREDFLRYKDEESQSKILCSDIGGSHGWMPVGFYTKLDPQTKEKRFFSFKILEQPAK